MRLALQTRDQIVPLDSALAQPAHAAAPTPPLQTPGPVPTHTEELDKFAPWVHSAAAATRNTEQAEGMSIRAADFFQP